MLYALGMINVTGIQGIDILIAVALIAFGTELVVRFFDWYLGVK